MRIILNDEIEELACKILSQEESHLELRLHELNNDKKQLLLDFCNEHELLGCLKRKSGQYWNTFPGYSVADKIISDQVTYLESLFSALHKIDTILEDEVEVVLLKNGAICKLYDVDYAETPMGDLDLLVEDRYFEKVLNQLLNNSFEINFRTNLKDSLLDQVLADREAELTYRCENGISVFIELQTRSVSGRWLDKSREPNNCELFETRVNLEGFNHIVSLSPEWNLIQVCLHTAKHSYIRAPGFRLHADVDRIIKWDKIDWRVFLKYVDQLRVQTPVYMSLYLAMSLLDTKIPDIVLKDIKPFVPIRLYLIRKILSNVGYFHPQTTKFSNLSYIIFTCLHFESFGQLTSSIVASIGKAGEKGVINRLSNLYSLVFKRNL
jgi:hypothetical protein